MSQDYKKDFILSKYWESLETNSDNGLQYRWTNNSSTIYITNSTNYTFLKVRLYNGVDAFNKRILNILVDGILYKSYIFTETAEYIDVKIDINGKKSVTFSTDDSFCPSKLDKQSRDVRVLGFKIYAIVIDSDNHKDVLIPIRDLTTESEEEFFVDVDNYSYNVSRIALKNDRDTIMYIGQYGTSGYATAAKGYVYRYFINNYDIKWVPLRFDETELSKDCPYNLIAESTINKNYAEYDTFIYHTTPDLWESLNHQYSNINKNKKIFGYAAWETSKLPPKWTEYINDNVNEVWCPSSYNYHVFKESGVTIPISVVPHVFLQKPLIEKKNIQLININGQPITSVEGVYTFYTIGEFNNRKGIDDIIKVFCKTFTKNDKVRLLIKTHYKNYTPNNKKYCLDKISDLVKDYTDLPEIHYLIDNASERDILALHSLGDCYVSLTKSEGFGIPIFDAFNYRKPIIVTGYGGHMDFLGKTYKGLVDFKMDYIKDMESFSTNYSNDTVWAYPNLDTAGELMKSHIK